jgi:hypothetical protein
MTTTKTSSIIATFNHEKSMIILHEFGLESSSSLILVIAGLIHTFWCGWTFTSRCTRHF